jgi:hypothetical protein
MRQATETARRGRPDLLQSWADKIAAAAVILALVAAAFTLFVSRQIYFSSLPEISLTAADNSPDAAFLHIQNNSRFLTLKNLRWFCRVDYTADLRLGASLTDTQPETTGSEATLAPSGGTTVRCPIARPSNLGPRVFLLVQYRFLWFKAGFQSARYKWSDHADPPSWVEDKLSPEWVPPRD